MKKETARKLISLFFLAAFCIGWSWPGISKKPLTNFNKIFSLILDNYDDQLDISNLVSASINGMEDMLSSNSKAFTKPNVDLTSIGGDREKAIKAISDSFGILEASSGAQPEQLEQAAIEGVLKSLDRLSTYMTKETVKKLTSEARTKAAGIGIALRLKNGLITVTDLDDGPALRAGIKLWDKIIKIDDASTEGMSAVEAIKKIRGDSGTTVTLTVMRKGSKGPELFKITRDKVKTTRSKMLGNGVGYIHIVLFQEETVTAMEDALDDLGFRDEKLKGIVLDLRNNTGGLLKAVVDIAGQFIESKKLICYIKGKSARQNMNFEGKAKHAHPTPPIFVLINNETASGAEILAGSLRENHKAVLLGTKTFGAGTIQTVFPLSDGSLVKLTTSKFFFPSGKTVQGGLIPDIEIEEKEDGDDISLYIALSALETAENPTTESIKEAAQRILSEKRIEIPTKEESEKINTAQ